ncbi:MAG: hypothetical protein [Microviridae sp.]|nr:MAG: hypothetical protein [Microviridae sp.]
MVNAASPDSERIGEETSDSASDLQQLRENLIVDVADNFLALKYTLQQILNHPYSHIHFNLNHSTLLNLNQLNTQLSTLNSQLQIKLKYINQSSF